MKTTLSVAAAVETRREGERRSNLGRGGNEMRPGDLEGRTPFRPNANCAWLQNRQFAIDLTCTADGSIWNRVEIIREVTWRTVISCLCHEINWWDGTHSSTMSRGIYGGRRGLKAYCVQCTGVSKPRILNPRGGRWWAPRVSARWAWKRSRRGVSRRGCWGGRLAEGCRRGGIGEVVSRRAVGEVSRVAVSGGSLGAGVSGLVSRDGVGGQTVPARLKKWDARKRRGPWKDGRGMRWCGPKTGAEKGTRIASNDRVAMSSWVWTFLAILLPFYCHFLY
jgi:hypothetical protein